MLEQKVIRLRQVEYQQLEKQLPTIHPTQETSSEQYALWCGIQLVLKKLREGFVIDEV